MQQSSLAAALQSDKDLLSLARSAAARGEIDEWEEVQQPQGPKKRQKASDDVVVARYKDRARKNAESYQKGIVFAK